MASLSPTAREDLAAAHAEVVADDEHRINAIAVRRFDDFEVLSVFLEFLKMMIVIVVESVTSDFDSFCIALLRSRRAFATENLFLRKQLALFQERERKASP